MPRLNRLKSTLASRDRRCSGRGSPDDVAAPRQPDDGRGRCLQPEFALADDRGQVRSSGEFRGRFLLVFFGFTNCPDICPTTLSEVAQVMDDLGPDATRVQPIFISVEPRAGSPPWPQDIYRGISPRHSRSGRGRNLDGLPRRRASRSTSHASKKDAASRWLHHVAQPRPLPNRSEGDWLRQFTYGTPASDIVADLKARF